MTDAVRPDEKAVSLTPYLILGFFVLVLALIVRAPASLLQKAWPASVPLQITAWGGTLWDGQALLAQGENKGFLSWQLQPKRLLAGKLAATVKAQGAVDLAGNVELGRKSWKLEGLHGEIPSAVLQSLLPPGWMLPGNVRAENLVIARDGRSTGPWRAAGGQLQWPGGPMQFNVNGQPQAATLPALTVNLRLDGETLLLSLNEQAGNLGLALVRLTPDGQAETQLRERLLRYSPGYHSSGADPDAVVVTAKQAL